MRTQTTAVGVKKPQPQDMKNPHAHHAAMKIGGGEWAAKSRTLLEKHGIDPYFGIENLVWAPNGQGNHTDAAAEAVYKILEAGESSGGKNGLLKALENVKKMAANGEFKQ